jgi:hypothetical protein
MNKFKNKYDKANDENKQQAKQDANEKLAKKANDIYKDKTFAEEQKHVYTIATILKVSSNLVSLLTCFFAILYVLKLPIGYYSALVLSCVVCVSLELMKNFVFKTGLKQKFRYNRYSLSLLVMSFLTALSLSLSALGAYVLLDEIGTNKDAAQYTTQDSTILMQLSSIEAQILANQKAQSNISAGINLTSSTNKRTLKKLTTQNEELIKTRTQLTEKLEGINNRLQTEQIAIDEANKAKNDTIKLVLVILAVAFELLFLVCSVYQSYYLFRVYVDNTSNKNSLQLFTTEKDTRIPTEEAHSAPNIGFKQYAPKDDSIKYIIHRNKKYTENAIRQNIAANKSKLAAAEKNDDDEKIERYARHLEKWQNYLKQVQE